MHKVYARQRQSTAIAQGQASLSTAAKFCREFGLETGGAMRSAVRTPPCEQGTRRMSQG